MLGPTVARLGGAPGAATCCAGVTRFSMAAMTPLLTFSCLRAARLSVSSLNSTTVAWPILAITTSSPRSSLQSLTTSALVSGASATNGVCWRPAVGEVVPCAKAAAPTTQKLKPKARISPIRLLIVLPPSLVFRTRCHKLEFQCIVRHRPQLLVAARTSWRRVREAQAEAALGAEWHPVVGAEVHLFVPLLAPAIAAPLPRNYLHPLSTASRPLPSPHLSEPVADSCRASTVPGAGRLARITCK